MAKLVVIGAGIMGLAAGYEATLRGQDVTVLEAAPEAGGMAAHFDLGGTSIERFYHFICKTDHPTFELLQELGIADTLRWKATSMGFYSNSRLSSWGDPMSLLRYPELSLWHKLRYALFAMVCVRRNTWAAIEKESAHQWIHRWCGEVIYNRFWRTLFEYKFYEYAETISAEWIWTRIRRIGRSRKSLLQEELGYLEGGSETLVNSLVQEITRRGGVVLTGSAVKTVRVDGGRVSGVETTTGFFPANYVISTVPTPYVAAMVPDLPEAWKRRYDSIHNIGVICVVFSLAKSVSPHFWVNVHHPGFQIPGVIEFSNLRATGNTSTVYVPYYMPVTNEKFSWTDEALLDESFRCLQALNPVLQRSDIVHTHVARLRHGQPICEAGFAAKIPPVQTPITGLQIADTCFYYPEDRGVAESIRLGRSLAKNAAESH